MMKNVFLILLSSFAIQVYADTLPKLHLDTNKVTVSGISSGGYMAAQYHIANSDKVKGAGIIAAGPYYCAQNSLITALGNCVSKQSQATDLITINQQILRWQQANKIPDISNLKDSKVWLLHGSKDEKVIAGVTDDLAKQYRQWLPADNIKYINNKPFAHHFPTLNSGKKCDQSVAPYLGNCHYDAAGEMLSFLIDNITVAPQQPQGKIIAISQQLLFDNNKAGMADTGYVYLPPQCEQGKKCQLHINFHGCNQFAEATDIGMTYIKHNGINRWADSNNMVVLYPQTQKSMVAPFNPQGCWDWWGYTNEHYATKTGLQISAINTIIAHLSSEPK